MKKLSKIDESVWGGILDRGTGETVRKEDDIINYSGEDMVEYIRKRYTIMREQDPQYSYQYDALDFLCAKWQWPEDPERTRRCYLCYEYKKNVISINEHILDVVKFNDEFNISTYKEGLISISPKSGEVNNKFFIKVIDYIIDNVSDNVILGLRKRKVNESVWGGILDRGTGEKVKKEDNLGNIQSLKPIDMGGSVLWSDQNLIVDGQELFDYGDYEEMFEVPLNPPSSVWRLPTLEEISELGGHNIYYDKEYIYLDDDRKISFKKCGVGYTSTYGSDFTMDDGDIFYGWTSNRYKYSSNSIHVLIIEHSGISYSPEKDAINAAITQNADSKCCIRLVRDK